MQHALTCPQRDDYERLIHGELPPPEVERLSQHLVGCSACAATVQNLLEDDTLLSVLRGPTVDATDCANVPAELTRRLLALAAPATSEPDGDNFPNVLSLLAPPQTPDEIGRLAHYRVLKVLGEGGMGIVFRAEDTLLDRTVALKTMKPQLAADPRHRQRFLREAQAAAKIEHDHIVPIYGVGEDNGVPWLAMPLLKGQSLDELLKQVNVLKPEQAIRLGIQVAKGLAAAHAAGLIHRDVKPGNIWVGPEDGGRAKLLDFGLARDAKLDRKGQNHLTNTGVIVGTPAFMAPEQADVEPLDARADLFSLGCVLYRVATGRLPFQGQGMMDTLRALATETPRHPHEVNPEVPRALSALIMGLLAKDRSARPASALAVVEALQALPENRNPGVKTTETTEWRAPAAATRRRRLVATTAVLLLMLGGAVAAGIVIIIKNKEGKEVARFTGPDGTTVEIKQDDDSGKPKAGALDSKPARRAAEWVLSLGGTIKIRQDGHERDIRFARDLPMDPFELILINLGENQKIDDAGLPHLRGLTNLTTLIIHTTRVSNAGLEHLKGLTNLRGLNLAHTRVTDPGLVHLGGLTELLWLDLAGTRVSDAGLARLKSFTNLTELKLWLTKVGDAGLAHLKDMTQLTVLDLGSTQVNDAGLEYLKGLTNLMELHLWKTRVSNAGLVHLKRLTRLTWLRLHETQVRDAGLEHLKGLRTLTRLDLDETQVSDDGLVHLKSLTNLERLGLSYTRVGDAGLAHLKGLNALTGLNLIRTQVSDAGLKHLAELRNLALLHLEGTRVTAEGVAALQRALPKCKIIGPATK